MNDIDLSLIQVLIISLTATVASVGASSMPGAGLVTMLIVLQSVGLPVKPVIFFKGSSFEKRAPVIANTQFRR